MSRREFDVGRAMPVASETVKGKRDKAGCGSGWRPSRQRLERCHRREERVVGNVGICGGGVGCRIAVNTADRELGGCQKFL